MHKTVSTCEAKRGRSCQHVHARNSIRRMRSG
jgi:hypothetical protein